MNINRNLLYMCLLAAETFHTQTGLVKDYSELWFSVLKETFVTFQLKSCNPAYIALMKYPGSTNDNSFEFGIGTGENNNNVYVAKERVIKESKVINDILPCSDFQSFWVSWDNKYVTLGGGTVEGQGTIISYMDLEKIVVTAVAFATGEGRHIVGGQWAFVHPQGMTILLSLSEYLI